MRIRDVLGVSVASKGHLDETMQAVAAGFCEIASSEVRLRHLRRVSTFRYTGSTLVAIERYHGAPGYPKACIVVHHVLLHTIQVMHLHKAVCYTVIMSLVAI